MSNRKTLIDILRRTTSATLAELTDATGWPERKVRDTLGDLKTAGLMLFERDDVTGNPLYRLTRDGAAWQPSVQQKKRSTTPAGGGDISPAPREPVPKDVTPQVARGVVEPPEQASVPAEARSDENKIEATPRYAAAIAAIGIANRELQRINADMNDALAACKEAYEIEAEPYRLKISELTDGLQIYAEANRATLTNNYKVKTVALTSGEITWRMNPPSVRLIGSEDEVIDWCATHGFEEFVRRTPSLNREAIKANPEEAKNVPGLKIGQSEAFVVTPFEAELSEAA